MARAGRRDVAGPGRDVAEPDPGARDGAGAAPDEDGGAAARVEADRRSRGGGAADRLPRLEAGAYRLRGFEPRDVPMVVEAGADPLIPLISSVAAGGGDREAGAFVDRQRHHLRDGHAYSFVVAERAGDRGVGSIGLWLREVDQGRATVGYWVVASARGAARRRDALRALGRVGAAGPRRPAPPAPRGAVERAVGADRRGRGLPLRGAAAELAGGGGRAARHDVYSLLAADRA